TRTGTRLEISSLRDEWTRGMVRSAQRAIMSICSPFDTPDSFVPSLSVDPNSDWLEGLVNPSSVTSEAPFKVDGIIHGVKGSGDFMNCVYEFRPPPAMTRIKGRRDELKDRKLAVKRDD